LTADFKIEMKNDGNKDKTQKRGRTWDIIEDEEN
jgi:hypothetical protein